MTSTETLIIQEEDLGQRLDLFLTKRFPDHSRTYFQNLIDDGNVLINGERCKKREKPSLGDEIEICFVLTPEISVEPQDIPLNVLYEDDHLIVVNKPAGMVVHPAPGHPNGTFVNALLHHCKKLHAEKGDLRPGIVHRLDKDTSGILVAAKDSLTHQRLVEMFCSRAIKKHYIAICIGNPGTQEISAPIGRHPTRRQEMAVVEDKGRPALSRCRTLSSYQGHSMAEIELITGRTHQIRVHLKHVGTPILGDVLYGNTSINKKFGLERQMLHAERVSFSHPISGIPLNITAPIPADMDSTLISLNLSR